MHPSQGLASIAALIAQPSRAQILDALFDGSAKSVGELATAGGVSLSTASEHVTKLAEGGLVDSVWVGRQRLVRLRDPQVAAVLEQLAGLGQPTARDAGTTRMPQLRAARTCYDHLAGRLGVALTEALVEAGSIHATDGAFDLSDAGTRWFADQGIVVGNLSRNRSFARACLDWTERRPHPAGSLGAALAELFLERRWIVRVSGSRALLLTPEGRNALQRELGDRPAWAARPRQRFDAEPASEARDPQRLAAVASSGW